MATLIITEKTSQARDLRAALGDRFGQILPAEGHLLRLAEPHEVNASWKSWACVLLKPDGLYPTRPASEGNKPVKLRAIAAALNSISLEQRVVIAELFYQRRSVAEVAAMLAIPEGTVRSRCFYGLRALRKALEQQGITRP